MPRTGSSRAEQAAGAAPPQDWIIQGQVAADAPDWNIRGRTRIRRSPNKKEQPKPQDSNGRSKQAWRTGQEHPGRNKQQEPPPPGLAHPGTSGGGCPGLEHPGRSKQQEPPPPGLEHPGTSGGRRPGLHHPGQNKKEQPQPEGQDHPGKNGLPPRARLPGAKQAG